MFVYSEIFVCRHRNVLLGAHQYCLYHRLTTSLNTSNKSDYICAWWFICNPNVLLKPKNKQSLLLTCLSRILLISNRETLKTLNCKRRLVNSVNTVWPANANSLTLSVQNTLLVKGNVFVFVVTIFTPVRWARLNHGCWPNNAACGSGWQATKLAAGPPLNPSHSRAFLAPRPGSRPAPPSLKDFFKWTDFIENYWYAQIPHVLLIIHVLLV